MKKYIICMLNPTEAYGYYNVVEYNHIDMLALHLGLTFLKHDPHIDQKKPYSFENLKNALFKTEFLLSEIPNMEEFCTFIELDLATKTVKVVSSYPWADENISILMEVFPEYTKEELKQHEYRMSVDNYLEILEKFLNFYATKVPYIILYEDDNKIVHCEEYFPTEEEKASNWKAIPNNQAK